MEQIGEIKSVPAQVRDVLFEWLLNEANEVDDVYHGLLKSIELIDQYLDSYPEECPSSDRYYTRRNMHAPVARFIDEYPAGTPHQYFDGRTSTIGEWRSCLEIYHDAELAYEFRDIYDIESTQLTVMVEEYCDLMNIIATEDELCRF